MSGVEKCCHFLELDSGCVVIGIFNICFNMVMLVLSILWLSLDGSDHHNLGVIPIELQTVSLDTILIIICIMAVLGLVSSVALVFGIKQNRPGYLLSYFSYGIVTTILLQLGALLFLLHSNWKTSMMLFISSCTFIYFVTVVHTTYDLMLRGKHFGFNPHTTLDTEVLVST